MTLEDNMGDLVRHAKDFGERQGFTYTVEEAGTGETIGCVYIYPPKADGDGGARVKSWVRADRASLDADLYRAVSGWLTRDWPFPVFQPGARCPARAPGGSCLVPWPPAVVAALPAVPPPPAGRGRLRVTRAEQLVGRVDHHGLAVAEADPAREPD